MKDRGIVASYLLSLSINLVKPENTNQYKPVKDSHSNKVKDLLINKIIPISPYDHLLILGDSNKKIELIRDLLKMILYYEFNADHFRPQKGKILLQFAKEMTFDEKAIGIKTNRDKSLIKLL